MEQFPSPLITQPKFPKNAQTPQISISKIVRKWTYNPRIRSRRTATKSVATIKMPRGEGLSLITD